MSAPNLAYWLMMDGTDMIGGLRDQDAAQFIGAFRTCTNFSVLIARMQDNPDVASIFCPTGFTDGPARAQFIDPATAQFAELQALAPAPPPAPAEG